MLPPLSLTTDSFNTANASEAGILATNEWGVAKIRAPEVWATGYNGQGVVIGSIDTGVLASHASIATQWRSSFGWFDPGAKKAAPYDDESHGTHTIGTMVGSSGMGVAPGAQFISCRGCTRSSCPQADLLACAQFMTCPTDPTGTIKDCSKAPRVINNSWAGSPGNTWFAAAINTWRAAEIIPVFAIGNQKPGESNGCGTASSPGDDPNVIGVGATDVDDALASFSLKGPSTLGALIMKPEITAPGVNVRSATITSKTAVIAKSGTSMATPHVTGVIALLLSRDPNLTFEEVRLYIISSTDAGTLKDTGFTCDDAFDLFPNNQYGYGRVNALGAMTALTSTGPIVTLHPPPTPMPTAAPTPTPTPAPTRAPTPAPGQCSGLNASGCEGVFFCSWDVMSQSCVRWWK